MFLADGLQHLVGPRADDHQKAAEPLPLEDGDLAIDGRDRIDLEADLDQVAAAHPGAFAGGQEDDHRLLGDSAILGHARSPSAHSGGAYVASAPHDHNNHNLPDLRNAWIPSESHRSARIFQPGAPSEKGE